MTARHRVAVFLPSLTNGGAERVMVNIANGLAASGTSVDLVLVEKDGPFLDRVSSEVRVIDLGRSRIASALFPLVSYLRSNRPDTMISALDPSNVLAVVAAALARSDTRVIVTEHCDVSSSLSRARSADSAKTKLLAKVLPRLLHIAYGRAFKVVAVSEGVADDLAQVAKLDRNAIAVIGNPVVTPELRQGALADAPHCWFRDDGPPVILGVGRLAHQKNFLMLIEAVALVANRMPIRLIILGDGEERDALEARVKEAGLTDVVDLPGFVDNPYAFMAAAPVFALSSRYEGLPTVLIEALYCGMRVVSTDCPSGPAEILDGGRYGELVASNDVSAFADALIVALESEAAPDEAAWNRFTEQTVIEEYERLFVDAPEISVSR